MIRLYEEFENQPHRPSIARNWSYSDLFVCWRSWRSCNRPFLFEMPQRRSQNLPLDDLLTLSRASGRRRKPTTRAEQPKTTDRAGSPDRAALFDRAVSPDRRRRRALISLNVDDSRLSSTSELSSTSWQFSSSESQLSSLSWRSESSSLRRSWSDSLSSLSRSKYWENELDLSKNKAERSIAFSAAEIAACAKHQKEQQNFVKRLYDKQK